MKRLLLILALMAVAAALSLPAQDLEYLEDIYNFRIYDWPSGNFGQVILSPYSTVKGDADVVFGSYNIVSGSLGNIVLGTGNTMSGNRSHVLGDSGADHGYSYGVLLGDYAAQTNNQMVVMGNAALNPLTALITSNLYVGRGVLTAGGMTNLGALINQGLVFNATNVWSSYTNGTAELIVTNGITLGGVRQTSWPSGGTGTAGTNIVVSGTAISVSKNVLTNSDANAVSLTTNLFVGKTNYANYYVLTNEIAVPADNLVWNFNAIAANNPTYLVWLNNAENDVMWQMGDSGGNGSLTFAGPSGGGGVISVSTNTVLNFADGGTMQYNGTTALDSGGFHANNFSTLNSSGYFYVNSAGTLGTSVNADMLLDPTLGNGIVDIGQSNATAGKYPFRFDDNTGNEYIKGTLEVSEVNVTNGITLGGVRHTSWPSGGSFTPAPTQLATDGAGTTAIVPSVLLTNPVVIGVLSNSSSGGIRYDGPDHYWFWTNFTVSGTASGAHFQIFSNLFGNIPADMTTTVVAYVPSNMPTAYFDGGLRTEWPPGSHWSTGGPASHYSPITVGDYDASSGATAVYGAYWTSSDTTNYGWVVSADVEVRIP